MMFSVFNIETLIFKINRIDFSDKINYICDKNGSGKTLFWIAFILIIRLR